MKKLIIGLAVALTAAGGIVSAGEPVQRLRPTQPFMRHKLDYARGILEGITLERFDLVATNALLLKNMTVTNSYMRLGNQQFRTAGTNFQIRVDALLRAAGDKDGDASAEAYTHVIKGCVECHHQFRIDQFVPGPK